MKKFYQNNKDLFLRYFDKDFYYSSNEQRYNALIKAGSLKEIEKTIEDGKINEGKLFGLAHAEQVINEIKEKVKYDERQRMLDRTKQYCEACGQAKQQA